MLLNEFQDSILLWLALAAIAGYGCFESWKI
jgi:hypothetical protein